MKIVSLFVTALVLNIGLAAFINDSQASERKEIGNSASCKNPINSEKKPRLIKNQKLHREFFLTGCADHVPPRGLPIIFAFHGGGEKLHTDKQSGFLDFTNLSDAGAIVIAPVGNKSHNGHSWINAFPWMDENPEDDLRLTIDLVAEIKRLPGLPQINFERVYALGKSDGSGMAMYLACHANDNLSLKAVALVSGAYFGVKSPNNFGTEPNQICVPKQPIKMILVHGSKDQVMPYDGQNFVNARALKHFKDYWQSKDSLVSAKSSNTFTANVEQYADFLAQRVNNCKRKKIEKFSENSLKFHWESCREEFLHIKIEGGNHVWTGHEKSGPDSGKVPNMDFDVTEEVLKFFDIHYRK
jgi:polyhydroxybutyrate depolymerase